jgi:hypothetical protein
MVGDHIKWTDHGTHPAGNAFARFDHDNIRHVRGAVECCRRADAHARRGIAVSAFVREGAVQRETRLGVDTRLGSRGLKNGHEKILGLRMCNCTGYFTLFTSYAALGVYENRFHNLFLSSSVVKKIKRTMGSRRTSFLRILFPSYGMDT